MNTPTFPMVVWRFYYKYDESKVEDTQPLDLKVNSGCTCGAVKASYPYPAPGHADYCDINNPKSTEEELPF